MKNPSHDIIDFTIVFNCYKKKLFNYIQKMIKDKMASEDIVQDIFLRFYEKIGDIKNPESIRFWLFKSARNEVCSHFRKKETHVDQFNVQDVDDMQIYTAELISRSIENNEFKKLIIDELEVMSVELKEPFIMKEFGGLSYKEISAVLEIDVNLVKSRLFSVRQRLIKKLSNKLTC